MCYAGKTVKLQAPNWKRLTRMDTLGENYTEKVLKEVISREKEYTPRRKIIYLSEPKKINLLVDIQAKLKTGKGAGYERWAKVFNLKQMARAMNYLNEHGLAEYKELEDQTAAATARYNELAE